MSLKTCVHCGDTLDINAAGISCRDCATWLGFGDTTCAAENAALKKLVSQLAEALKETNERFVNGIAFRKEWTRNRDLVAAASEVSS